MDKLEQKNIITLRNGFALLLTLSILAIIIGLSGVLISYMTTARSNAITTKALIQSNIVYADIQSILKKFQKQKDILYEILYTMPLSFNLKNNKSDILLKCRPLANGVNINWLIYSKDPRFSAQFQATQKVFEYLAQRYNIANIALLEEKIIAKIKNKDSYNDFFGRLHDRKFILSFKDFEKILFDYLQEEDDKNIMKIPWNRYFVYNVVDNNPNNNLIDSNYISSELISILFDIEIELVKDEWRIGKSKLDSFLGNYGIKLNKKLFANKFYMQTQCEVYYSYMGSRFKFTFDDINDEVKYFEFYTKQ